ncbi:MAG TPA: MFS transporter [Actinophytocola sp.]|uniref:MFS transporter n=1 Tax=Actinophytocola sp. TaxID=1872138 RepID=UPI002DDD578B|nr:MFS transporter [Actinophytocola sp.]HEV2781264.1 MFS transporter [Actinophytocola sp.]
MDMRAASFREVFAVAEFRALWFAELQSVAGDQLARVALSVLVFSRTGSAALTATTYALTLLPDLVSGPLLSGLADRFPRRRVMVVCDLARAALVGVMAVPDVPLPVLAALLVVVQLFAAPFTAAHAATMPVVLTGDRYVVGHAIRYMSRQSGLVAGFAGGGAVVALIGTGQALALDAVTFALSAALIGFGVRPRPAPEPSGPAARSAMGRMRAGGRVIMADPRLRGLVGLAWLAGFVVVPEGLAAPYAAEIGAGPAAIGLLLAAHPAGLVAGSFVIRWLDPPRRLALVAPMAVAAIAPLVPFALRPGLVPAVVLLLISGACGAYQITASATFMRTVPDERRGQAFGLAGSGLVAVQGLGVAAGGLVAQAFGSAALAIALAGIAGLPAGLLTARGWFRANRNGFVARRDDSIAKSVR